MTSLRFNRYTKPFYIILLIVSISIILSKGSAYSESATFLFRAPDASNPVNIRVDSLFEMNKGTAAIINGNLCIDPPSLDISCGKIIIPSAAIIMSNRVKTAMLHSKKWLNKTEYPNIVFEFNAVEKIIQSTGRIKDLLIRGELTIKETTKTAVLPVKIICDAGFDQINKAGITTPQLILESSFSISRAAFNIKPDVPSYIIDDTIYLDIHICGVKKNGDK